MKSHRQFSPPLLAIFALACLVLCACSSHRDSSSTGSASSTALEEMGGHPYPFTFKILHEINDGSSFHVRGEVISDEEWPKGLLALRLLSYRQGELIDRSDIPFEEALTNKITEDVFEAGKAYEFVVSAPVQQVSDYQLDLVWGDDARAMLAGALPASKDTSAVPLVQLRIADQQILREDKNCNVQPCVLQFAIKVALINDGSSTAETAVIELGLLPDGVHIGDDSALVARQEIELTGLGLKPGATRAITLNYEEELTEPFMGQLKPQLRVLTAQ